MAAIGQTVPKLIRNLKDNTKQSLQLGALTYIRSNAEKLEKTSSLDEEEYSEICKLIMDAVGSSDQTTINEAAKALEAVLKHFKNHKLNFFESALRVDGKKRLKILEFLETVDDDALVTATRDVTMVNFINDCLRSVETTTMEWLSPSSCTDNLRIIAQAESRLPSDDPDSDEPTIERTVGLLRRLYKIASATGNFQTVQRLDSLVMDKIVTLAYMGHGRQRAWTIPLLRQAIGANLGLRIKKNNCDIWGKYKNDLQGPYCTRMALLVKSCEMDWSSLWAISVELLGTDLHRGATLINNLLSVEERAFKSTDTNVRRQAFVSWKLLIDNFALDPKELATARRIKLLCVPLTAKNSKSELIALTKLEVWWYLITKLHPNISKFAEPVITPFLNFCFGPLGDTPLLSAKVDVIASPGKRFFKTKVVAIDALLQLTTLNENDRKALLPPILEQRLSHSITDQVFQQCYKTFLHSIGEAIVIISQLHEGEMKNRVEIIGVLLKNLMRYVKSTSAESKAVVYNEFILVVTELQNRALGICCVDNFVSDVVVPELSTLANDLTHRDGTLVDFISKIITPSVLKSVKKKHCESIRNVLWQTIKPKGQEQLSSDTLKFLKQAMDNLQSVPTDETGFADCFELWFVYAEMAYKYALTENVNEATGTGKKFQTIEAIIRFPFAHMYSSNSIQAQRIAINWKDLYKQFELKADAISDVKPNEIFDDTAIMIQHCLVKNDKCYRIASYCLDALLGTINYTDLLARTDIPTIVRLVADLTTIALREGQPGETVCTLKALSSLLITVYGHCPEKALAYLKHTSQTIEFMLKTDADQVVAKEITSTWETIVSIVRGLNAFLDSNFFASYKSIILLAIRHSNTEIASQAEAVIAMKENVGDGAKAILGELDEEWKKWLLKVKSDKADRGMKQVKISGSFMNRKVPSPRPIVAKQKDRDDKKLMVAPLPPEPDSQDYVVIKSDVKLDVSRLTEHQKESLKRRRDDIPAMYNDLSQSSSQDTQDLQQWFDGKIIKRIEPVEKSSCGTAVENDDPNKENKIDKILVAGEDKTNDEPVGIKTIVVQKIFQDKSVSEIPKHDDDDAAVEPNQQQAENKCPTNKKDEVERTRVDVGAVPSSLVDHSYVGTPIIRDPDCPNQEETVEVIAKKLDFESRDEYPDEKFKDAATAAASAAADDESITGGKGNRTRRSNKLTADASVVEQTVKRPRAHNRGKPVPVARELRNSNSECQDETGGGDGIKTRGAAAAKPRGIGTRRSHSNVIATEERGVKRRAASDSESEGNERNKRFRRKESRSPSATPSDTESPAPVMPIDKRTGNEMSRLRIDMVFDGPLPSRRRSKLQDESGLNSSSSDTLGRRLSPDLKVNRGAKTAEIRTSDNNLRRRLRGSDKEGSGNVDVTEKRRRKSNRGADTIKPESLRENDGIRPKLTTNKKINGGNNDNSASQTIVDDEDSQVEDKGSVSNVKIDESAIDANEDADDRISTPNTPEERVGPDNDENLVATIEEPVAATTTTTTAPSNDDDEVIENSQGDSAIPGNNRKSIVSGLNFVNENNNADQPELTTEPSDSVVKDEGGLPRASSPINTSERVMGSKVFDRDGIADEKMTHDDSDETFLDISAIRSQPVDTGLALLVPDDADNKAREDNGKITSSDGLAPSKTESSFNYSSPKNPSKRFIKPKSFVAHGRAAHMLGLVTKLAVLEKNGCEVERSSRTEEEMGGAVNNNKRYRTKENENEQPTIAVRKDRSTMIKDSERMGSPGGGSRQEKIFNNMKSGDYAASPPGKLFGNLKNNGERVSPKMAKIHGGGADGAAVTSSLDSDASVSKDEGQDASRTSERDELPMLEWSSANPPSLTASPSASILKRVRRFASDTDTDNATMKSSPRKRVSFADPPVSKEMGYEVASTGSPLKITKFMSRSPFDRKSSPLRFKQSRLRMIQTDAEITEKDDEQQQQQQQPARMLISSDIDLDCERENALLVKIAEDLEDTAEYRAAEIGLVSSNITERPDTDDRRGEIKVPEAEDTLSWKRKDTTIGGNVETQDDLFNSSDEKNQSPKRFDNASKEIISTASTRKTVSDDTFDSLKLNVTDDSIIGSIIKLTSGGEDDRSEILEDTMDVRNLPSLNSTASSDEIFCEKPVRTSTQAPDGVSQMDTLPITDSVFSSLPITQDSQESMRANLDAVDNDSLNGINPIYPSLVDCTKPIEAIVIHLTNPLWFKNLSNHLTMRGICTVGDFARLSEREIIRIPVKGSPKIEFVRKVLRRFEDKLVASSPSDTSNTSDTSDASKSPGIKKKDDRNVDYLALVSDNDNSINVDEAMDFNELPTLDVSAVTMPSQERSNGNGRVTVEDSDFRVGQSLRRTSTTMDSVVTAASIYTLLDETPSMARMSTINLSSDTTTGAMRNVATSTESLPKPPSKSVGSQISLEDLLDDIDGKLVLQSAVKRCSAETLLAQYKLKMGHMPDVELAKETMRMLAIDSTSEDGSTSGATSSEAKLKAACRAWGANKVLPRLPDIFINDKQFFVKVLNAYRKKIKLTDWMESLVFEDIKKDICKKLTPAELTEMLLKKEENTKDGNSKVAEVDRLNAILKNMPFDTMIGHTVANKELIPSSIVLDIALQDNEADAVTDAIESQYPEIARKIIDKKLTTELITSHIEHNNSISKDNLLNFHRAVCAKLSPTDLLDAYHQAMKRKFNENLD